MSHGQHDDALIADLRPSLTLIVIIMSSPPVLRLGQTSPPLPSIPDTPAITKLKSLLRQFIRVTTSDGRIFIGTFAGTDKLLNIILTNAEEYRFVRSSLSCVDIPFCDVWLFFV